MSKIGISPLKSPRIIEMAKRTRKGARKVSRRRRTSRRRTMRGGWVALSPAPVGDAGMAGPMKMSLAQGQEYEVLHEGQHGGGSGLLGGAPAFESQTLPSNLVEAARVGGTLKAYGEIQGMKDQGGGGKRRRGRKSRKSRRGRKSRRKQGGGAHMHPADADAPGMLLSGKHLAGAEAAMNPEWALAKNPASFAPKH